MNNNCWNPWAEYGFIYFIVKIIMNVELNRTQLSWCIQNDQSVAIVAWMVINLYYTLLFLQYQHVHQTKRDVEYALDQYRGLTFKKENFGIVMIFFWLICKSIMFIVFCLLVFNDGNSKELLNINGTIPVVYKSELTLK